MTQAFFMQRTSSSCNCNKFFLDELTAVVLVVDHMDLRQDSGVSEFIDVGLDEIAIDAAILGNTVSKLLLTH